MRTKKNVVEKITQSLRGKYSRNFEGKYSANFASKNYHGLENGVIYSANCAQKKSGVNYGLNYSVTLKKLHF